MLDQDTMMIRHAASHLSDQFSPGIIGAVTVLSSWMANRSEFMSILRERG